MAIKVIAIGNILMGDDSIGIRVLESIGDSLKSYGIEVIAGETDFQYCLSEINDDDYIIILDAAMLERQAGTITIIPLEEYNCHKKYCTAHSNSLLDFLYTYHKDIKGFIIGIEIEKISYDLNISRNLELLLEEISLNVLNTVIDIVSEAKNNFIDF